VAALNYEINLHCKEDIRDGRFSRFPAFIAGLLILSLLTIAIVYAGGLLYASHLKSVIAVYEADVRRLTAETNQLEALEERTLLISLKTDLEAELQPASQPLSETLRQVNSNLSENLNMSSVTVEKNGIVYIIGTGTKLQSVAAYSQALVDLSFVEASDITEIKLAESGLYYFKLELRPGEDTFHETGN
jgi:hypothetical protein